MRVLIVKLSSMGDVIHALPVVQDLLRAYPEATVDWAVEPAFAPLVQRAAGIGEVIDVPLRRWTRTWWTATTRRDFMRCRARLRRDLYDGILDLQGLTKSALISVMARGHRYALANRTEGSSYEPATRWVARTAIPIEPHVHALDRSRIMAAKALNYKFSGPPDFGLRRSLSMPSGQPGMPRTVAFLHGTSRDDKLWPENCWVALGRKMIGEGWCVGLPQGNVAEAERARRIASLLGTGAEAWPLMPLGELMDKLGACAGAIGVDSGLSHLAVAMDLPHVQIYNFPTAWRTGPLEAHGHRHQVALVGDPTPGLEAVEGAWTQALERAARTTQSPRDLSSGHIHEVTQAMSRGGDFADDGKSPAPSATSES